MALKQRVLGLVSGPIRTSTLTRFSEVHRKRVLNTAVEGNLWKTCGEAAQGDVNGTYIWVHCCCWSEQEQPP